VTDDDIPTGSPPAGRNTGERPTEGLPAGGRPAGRSTGEPTGNRPGDDAAEDSLSLVREAQAGDRAAYERLFAHFYPRVLGIVRARLGERLRRLGDSGDFAQEAMVQAIRSFDRFEVRTRAELVGWLAKIVEFRMREANQRANVREPELADVAAEVGESIDSGRLLVDPEDPGSRPLSQLLRSERAAAVALCLAELPEPQRELMVRRIYQGASWDAIAAKLDYPSPDAARMAYGRVRVELGKRLAERGDGA